MSSPSFYIRMIYIRNFRLTWPSGSSDLSPLTCSHSSFSHSHRILICPLALPNAIKRILSNSQSELLLHLQPHRSFKSCPQPQLKFRCGSPQLELYVAARAGIRTLSEAGRAQPRLRMILSQEG